MTTHQRKTESTWYISRRISSTTYPNQPTYTLKKKRNKKDQLKNPEKKTEQNGTRHNNGNNHHNKNNLDHSISKIHLNPFPRRWDSTLLGNGQQNADWNPEWWGDLDVGQLQIQIKPQSQFEFVPRDTVEFDALPFLMCTASVSEPVLAEPFWKARDLLKGVLATSKKERV